VRRAALPAAIAAGIICCCLPAAAAAAPGLTTGFADPLFTSGNQAEREDAFDRSVDARAGIARINVLWRTAATAQPATPANPADPAYNFAPYDAAVKDAVARGLEPLLTIYRAPTWAEGPGRPAGTPAGSWRPQPQALADFTTALATRYSGSFGVPEQLPRVRLFQVWNEPNLVSYLNPAADRAPVYTGMLNAAYGAIKAVHADNVVVTAGTAPYGDPPGSDGNRTRPLIFWRGVLCTSGCAERANFDVLAHHPINTSGGPTTSALNPDDVSTPDLGALRAVLRDAERNGQTGTPGTHELWVTEIWWESDPPDGFEGVKPKRHGRWIEQAMYLLWKKGARVVLNLQVRDTRFTQDAAFADTATGVFFADGSAKPAYTGFRFPFVGDRKSKRKVRAWGKSPVAGRLKIQRKRGSKWRRVDSFKVDAGEVFNEKVALRRKPLLRAKVGGETSLTWRVDGS
jgi:hypothetical protein